MQTFQGDGVRGISRQQIRVPQTALQLFYEMVLCEAQVEVLRNKYVSWVASPSARGPPAAPRNDANHLFYMRDLSLLSKTKVHLTLVQILPKGILAKYQVFP